MNNTAAFVMPVKISGSERDIRFLREAVYSIRQQTDDDWILIMVDDYSDDEKVSAALEEICSDLKEKADLIRLEQNVGAGQARNVGVRRAAELGAPFILYNDSDDISDPRRLELVRKAFAEDETVNVVYLSFDIVDEKNNTTPYEDICLSVREIIDGHQRNVVEGENAWSQIAIRKGYTNLTSCTAVRTWLALKEPFPARSVSEDAHTWMRYGAYPGKFAFIRDIKNHYRICTDVASRSRSLNNDFYDQKSVVDRDGFEEALKLAKSFGRLEGDGNDIRAAFYVRLALSLLYGDADSSAAKLICSAKELSPEKTLEAIANLDCLELYRQKLRDMAEDM